jgi:hypothetical protein
MYPLISPSLNSAGKPIHSHKPSQVGPGKLLAQEANTPVAGLRARNIHSPGRVHMKDILNRKNDQIRV